jgi:hypothetical protein
VLSLSRALALALSLSLARSPASSLALALSRSRSLARQQALSLSRSLSRAACFLQGFGGLRTMGIIFCVPGLCRYETDQKFGASSTKLLLNASFSHLIGFCRTTHVRGQVSQPPLFRQGFQHGGSGNRNVPALKERHSPLSPSLRCVLSLCPAAPYLGDRASATLGHARAGTHFCDCVEPRGVQKCFTPSIGAKKVNSDQIGQISPVTALESDCLKPIRRTRPRQHPFWSKSQLSSYLCSLKLQ